MDIIYEVNIKDGKLLVDEIIELEHVTNVALLSHDGEVRA